LTSSYRFGPFLVNRDAYQVVRDGETVAISPKHLDLLLQLLACLTLWNAFAIALLHSLSRPTELRFVTGL